MAEIVKTIVDELLETSTPISVVVDHMNRLALAIR